MSTIKGQNLRLLVGGKCIAASTSCAVHVAASVESSSTKDSGDWEENEVVGLSWDASADALVLDAIEEGNAECNDEMDLEGVQAFRDLNHRVFHGFITAKAEGVTVYIANESNEVLAEGVGEVSYDIGENVPEDLVYFATSAPATVHFAAFDGEPLSDVMLRKRPVSVRFSHTGGEKNRTESQNIFSGEAIITDFSLNAPNRQKATYTVQMEGVGDLQIGE